MALSKLRRLGAPKNPKRHAVEELEHSIERWGYVDPIVLDERSGRIIHGHGRRDRLVAIHDAGKEPPDDAITVDDAGEWWIPVYRGWASKNDEEAEDYAIATNRLTEIGGWDQTELLASLKRPAVRLKGLGFKMPDIRKLANDLKPKGPTSEAKDAKYDDREEEENPIPQLGDFWTLGDHRLGVGDSLEADFRGQLLEGVKVDAVVQDPPYAIYGSASGISSSVADDSMVRPFFKAMSRALQASLKTYGHAYVFCDWRSYPVIAATAHPRMTLANCIIWTKSGSGLGSMWANTYEMVAFYHHTPPARTMGGREAGARQVFQPNHIHANRPTGTERRHNAAKPRDLLTRFIEAATDPGERVGDFFGGSGQTLLTCQDLGRRCYMAELKPGWAHVILERWVETGGADPVRSDGAKWSDLVRERAE